MARTVMDLDPTLLQKAKEVLGTSTNAATVREALSRLVRGNQRQALANRLRASVPAHNAIDAPEDIDEFRAQAWDRG